MNFKEAKTQSFHYTPTMHWALLIGVDFYKDESCLKGAVKDVTTIEQFLSTGSQPANIALLTARILSSAVAGDCVYIHYSGHGTRRPVTTTPTPLSTHLSGNLAFVLSDPNKARSEYLPGMTLAKCPSAMVKRGLHVTVVLDCCYSGSVLRGNEIRGSATRSVDYDPTLENDSRTIFDSDDAFRDTVDLKGWMVDPQGYTILAACSLHEEAFELTLINGESRGALSYFLTDVLADLRKNSIKSTHESLYEQLRVRFRASWSRQTPVRYGNRNSSFFEAVSIRLDTAPTLVDNEGSRLCLNAGEVHGVQDGDEYVLLPPFGTGHHHSEEVALKARVDGVGCVTSNLVEINPRRSFKVETGWQVRPVTATPRRPISVRVEAPVHETMLLAQDLADKAWLHICTNEEPEAAMFHIRIHDHQAYEILDASRVKIQSLPTVPINAPGARGRIMSILKHLAHFKYAEGLENRLLDTILEDSSFELNSSIDNQAFTASKICELPHNRSWTLRAVNRTEHALYFTILNFIPSWEIQNLLLQRGCNSFQVIEAGSREKIEMGVEVPGWIQRQGIKQCEDLIKVVIMTRPTTFPAVILAAISLGDDHRGYSPGATACLPVLIERLTAQYRGGPSPAKDTWTTRSFILRTIIK